MKFKMLILVSCTIMLIMNCTNNTKSNNSDSLKYSIKTIPAKCINANNDFSINLFRTLNKEVGDRNIFISPVSASFALGMTMNGADGNTFHEMKNTLGFCELNIEKINNTYATLIDELYNVSDGVEFNLANAIWHDESLSIQPEFYTANTDYFNAKIDPLNFLDKTNCKNTVNSWVEEQTEEKIKDFTKESDFVSVMVLVNAIYFNASWKYQFNEDESREKNFYLDNNDVVNCEMMSQKNKLKFLFDENYQALELPYANDNYSMLLIQPESGLDEFTGTLSNSKLASIIDEMEKDSINITLPKFELTYEKELSDVLKSMGMIEAFDPNKANFSNIFNEISNDIYIKLVRHKNLL